jgi:CheY-like chemotaxis protein
MEGISVMKHIRKTILIVEDSPVQALALQMMLQNHGANILHATRGDMVLEMACRTLPDAILLDVELPGVNGLEVCRLLRDDLRTLEIPIILFTTYDDQETVRKSFAGGPIEFIPKDIFYPIVLPKTLQEMQIIER